MSKIDGNKEKKELAIYEAAYILFTQKDINKVTVSGIAKQAGVAKGTFYLYFKSKYSLLDKLIVKKSYELLMESYLYTKQMNLVSYNERILYFINHIIDLLSENRILLKLLHKNLSWGMFNQAVDNKVITDIINNLIHELYSGKENNDLSEEDFYKVLFMVIELTSSVCYHAIIEEKPANIEEMKPLLLNMIKKVI
jgi:AcrR family transcriptional regulator